VPRIPLGSEARRTRRGRAGPGVRPRRADPRCPGRDHLAAIGPDLLALWHAPTTVGRDRKRLLRTLIADVTLLPGPARAKARTGIRLHADAAGQLIITRPRPAGIPDATPSPAAELVRRLGLRAATTPSPS
jgi:hypothetical protein